MKLHYLFCICNEEKNVKGIVHFEINFLILYVLAYLKGIQDVGVFVPTVFSILILFGQTVVVYQSGIGVMQYIIKQDIMTRKCKYTLMA